MSATQRFAKLAESLVTPRSLLQKLNKPNPFAETDLCVKCGLCLPHCPTYTKTLDENESPRGRISLIQAWASGALEASPRLQQHLDNCLLCRSCERVCPAQVPYGQLVDRFRIAVGKPKRTLSKRLVAGAARQILAKKTINKVAVTAMNKFRSLNTHSLIAKAEFLKRIGLPNLQQVSADSFGPGERHEHYIASPEQVGRVGLFLGCTGELLDAETIDSAIKVLHWLGYSVEIPANQGCCGALDLHAGNKAAAVKLAEQNITAFGADLDAIVSIASGCGSVLKEYPLHNPQARDFAQKVQDISEFVANLDWPTDDMPDALDAKVSVHAPCSLRNVLRAEAAPVKVIQAIPESTVIPLPDTTHCCGAAGTYMIEHPEMATLLRDDVLDSIAETNPDYLATSNIGCALHIRTGLLQRGLNFEVLHPIVLLARQLPDHNKKQGR